MTWFSRLAQSYSGDVSPQLLTHYAPEHAPITHVDDITKIYQSKDFPHVFLGSADDLGEVQNLIDESVCRIVDVSKNLPEHPVWNIEDYQQVNTIFVKLVNQLARIIASTKCPIYVHCKLGANRSVAVLAGAIAKLTGRPVFDVLKEIKTQRGIVAPQDAYIDMLMQNFDGNEQLKEQVRQHVQIASKKAAGPPPVTIVSFVGDLLTVDIGGKPYYYYANPGVYKKIDFYTKNGWHGKALQVLNKLERMQ